MAKPPDSARLRISDETGWPSGLVAAAGVGVRGVIPRGTLFERFMTCPSEPTRNGSYQFCVVGLDVSTPGQLRYMGWEPTGYFDRWFPADEVELRLALQRAGRSLGQAKDGQEPRASGARRWPDAGDPLRGQVCNGLLPELSASGNPVLSPSCKHHPRTTIDLLGPLLHEWQRRFLPALRLHTARPRLLVFDSSGRLARHLQESLEDFEVVAVDDRTVPKRRSLGSLHEKAHFEVKADVLKTSPPALDAKAEAFDVVLVPFALHRLCWGEERLLLALWRESLRCAGRHLLLAEDLPPPVSEETLAGWRAVLQGDWSSTILQEGSLAGCEVKDHFLSKAAGPVERRYLIVDASAFLDRREGRSGQPPNLNRSQTTHFH